MAENQNTSTYDNPFWLQILGDQMRFIWCALIPRETDLAEQAEHFITLFDTLYAQSTEYLPDIALERFLDTAYNVTQQSRTFCLVILRRQICGDACINMSPGFLNQMANEAEEYLRTLDLTIKKRPDLMHPIHYHAFMAYQLLYQCRHHKRVSGSVRKGSASVMPPVYAQI